MSAPSISKVNRRLKTLPDIDWVEIPAGEFIFGSEEEENEDKLFLEAFYIGRYPVTHIQYQTFIDDGGYENERWWRDLKKPKIQESEWRQSNRPKTDVGWVEAVAFCRWLSTQLAYKIQLPSEPQWEKAARGTDGRRYPWGEAYQTGYANVDEKEKNDGSWYLKETTAVGLYPHGNSPRGIADMAGNIWEWCQNKHQTPEVITTDTSGDSRVLRGGSWSHPPELARAAVRSRYNLDDRYHGRGFRVCCVLPFPL